MLQRRPPLEVREGRDVAHLPEADAVEHAQRRLVAGEDLAQHAPPLSREALQHGGEDRRAQAAGALGGHQGDIDDATSFDPRVDHDAADRFAAPLDDVEARRGKPGAVRRHLRGKLHTEQRLLRRFVDRHQREAASRCGAEQAGKEGPILFPLGPQHDGRIAESEHQRIGGGKQPFPLFTGPAIERIRR